MGYLLFDADPDALHLREVAQALRAEIAAEPRLLVAAERHAGVVEVVRIDPHRSGLDASRDGVRLLDVLRPDARRQAVVDAVGLRHGVVDAVEADHRQHRAEDLLLGDAHRVVDALEHRGLDEPTLAVDRLSFAARGDTRTLAAADVDVAQHLVHLVSV